MSETAPSYDVRVAHRRLLGVLDRKVKQGLENDITQTMWTTSEFPRQVYLIGGAAVYNIADRTYFDDVAIVHDPFGSEEGCYDFHVFGEGGNWYRLTSQVSHDHFDRNTDEYVLLPLEGSLDYSHAQNYSTIVEQFTTFDADRTALAAQIMEQEKLYALQGPDNFSQLLQQEYPEV